jgi:hypothetical protein
MPDGSRAQELAALADAPPETCVISPLGRY